MASISLFAVPVSTPSYPETQQSQHRKRKRHQSNVQTESPPPLVADHDQSVEYTAIVTPLERTQRRLAGLPLDQQPPPPPFPHASCDSSHNADLHKLSQDEGQRYLSKQSLHTQHLAAMTSLLHRCMMDGDFIRAGRALGLLLRNEVGGRKLDIRHEGLWGIGAEILLRTSNASILQPASRKLDNQPSLRGGIERARLYYERLIVLYPQHKTWLDAVSARDFCTALFNSWIYVANQDSSRLQEQASTVRGDSPYSDDVQVAMLEAKSYELEQAKQIADAMDTYMRSAPFNTDHELIYLRVLVALWTADILDICTALKHEKERSQQAHELEDFDQLLGPIEQMVIDAQDATELPLQLHEASKHRDLAQNLLERLQGSKQRSFLHNAS